MRPLNKVYQTLIYYRDETLGILARLVPGVTGILIIKYTSVLDFLEYHPNFDLIFYVITPTIFRKYYTHSFDPRSLRILFFRNYLFYISHFSYIKMRKHVQRN